MKRKTDKENSKFQYNPPAKRRKFSKKSEAMDIKKAGKKGDIKAAKKIKGVMFVPYTKHSELAQRLRDNEERMEEMTGYRIKIVEKGGTKLVDILHKANPWEAKIA